MHRSDHYEFFSQPKFLSGLRALENIPVELDSLNARRPMVIAQPGRCRTKKLVKALKDSGLTIGAFYDDIPDFSSIRLAVNLAVLYRSRECDSIIALGGGPVMEIARTVNILVQERDMRLALEPGRKIPGPLNPLVYVYAGECNGYETSSRACLDTNSVESPYIYPDLICIDNRFVRICRKEEILNRSLRAFTHGIEACAGTAASPMTETYAGAAIRFVTDNLAALLKNPRNGEASLGIANATACGGVAFSSCADGLAHTLGEILSCQSGQLPGILMGILLPRVMEYRFHYEGKDAVNPSVLIYLAGMDAFSSIPEKERAEKAVAMLGEYIFSLKGMPPALKDLGITPDIIEAAAVITARRNPDIKQSVIKTVLEHAWDGNPVTKKGGAR